MKASYSQLEEEPLRKEFNDETDIDSGSVRRLQKEEWQQTLDRQNAANEAEGVFEIRDFSAASAFEKLVHHISMATKRWCVALSKEPATEAVCLEEEFSELDNELGEIEYKILFQYAPVDSLVAPTSSASSATSPASSLAPHERLGLHSFPSRAHRVHRWFGVQHFAILSLREQDLNDINRARTLLSALVLAVRSQSPPRVHPLSCFIPVFEGRNQRFIGEVVNIGWRTVYTTGATPIVDPSLEHLEGMLNFFCQKLNADPEERAQSLTMGARFTYLAIAFEPLPPDGGLQLDVTPPPSSPASPEIALRSRSMSGNSENAESEGDSEDPEIEEDSGEAPEEVLEYLQLHVLWPSFRRHSFVDDAHHSELDPRAAPYWKLRVTCKDNPELSRSKRLKNLLSFRNEAKAVQSAEQSVQPVRPKNVMDSLSVVVQESLESLLLPAQDQLDRYLTDCFDHPVCVSEDTGMCSSSPLHAKICGAVRGTRLVRLTEFASDMKCFKGILTLWCQALAWIRRDWDQMEDNNLEGSVSPPTKREPGNGMRAEFFSTSNCLLQQKLEMLQRSFQTRSGSKGVTTNLVPTGSKIDRIGDTFVAPPSLVSPALFTEDMVVQRNLHRESMTDPMELSAFVCGREIQFDASAFKAANETANLDDFLAWRSDVEGLDNQVFPREWYEKCWADAIACPACRHWGTLFEPERELMMALHYLSHIEGTQLLLQLFRVLLSSTIEDLSDVELVASSPHLCSLRDRAIAVAIEAFKDGVSDAVGAVVGEQIQFPEEESLKTLIKAVEDFDKAVALAGSLRHKLPNVAPALLEDLVAKGEGTVTSFDDRQVIADLLERCHHYSDVPNLPIKVIDALPHCKEFIILFQPDAEMPSSDAVVGRHKTNACDTQRLYAEIRQRHLRLAMGHSMRLV